MRGQASARSQDGRSTVPQAWQAPQIATRGAAGLRRVPIVRTGAPGTVRADAMIRIFCDRCGQEQPKGTGYANVAVEWMDARPVNTGILRRVDLIVCADCAERVSTDLEKVFPESGT